MELGLGIRDWGLETGWTCPTNAWRDADGCQARRLAYWQARSLALCRDGEALTPCPSPGGGRGE